MRLEPGFVGTTIAYQKPTYRGLKLLDPEISLTDLRAKWIPAAIEPGISGLKTLFGIIESTR